MNSDSNIIIHAQGLTKSFGDIVALKPTNLSVGQGELFGLIGPDGAGKTTLIRMLTSLLLPDAGRGSVLGFDVVSEYREVRKRIGYMPGRFSLYQDLSVRENLEFFASIFGVTIEQNYDLIRDIYQQIEPFESRRAGALSGGMKQKLALSCALIHRPELLFLDEPTTGVDAVSRREFWDMLDRLRDMGLTILVSTPYMDEASRCDRIALMMEGEILLTDTPDGIRNGLTTPLFAVQGAQKYALLQHLRTLEGVEHVFPFGEDIHVSMNTDVVDTETINKINLHLKSSGFEASVREIKPHIEDVFLSIATSKSMEVGS